MGKILLPPHIQKAVDDKKSLEAVGNWYNHYMDWKEDTSRIELFKNSKQQIVSETILIGNQQKDIYKMLVEAYIYVPPKQEGDLVSDNENSGLTARQELDMKSLPFIKVLWHRDPNMIGKIFSVNDTYASVRVNPGYREWNERLQSVAPNDRPRFMEEVPPPPRYASGWIAMSKYNYKIEKFKETSDLADAHTFLIPENGFILTESNI